MILILGPEDIHTMRVLDRIRAQGQQAVIMDSARYPVEIGLSYDISSPSSGELKLPNASPVALSEISAVYWYAHHGVRVPYSPDARDVAYRQAEAEAALDGFLANLDCLWVNPAAAIAQHRLKTHQLQLLKRADIRVPDSLITNDGDALRAFYDKHDGRVICKPLYQGTLLHRLTKADFSPERLNALAANPVLFQEAIEGVDIRIHMISEQAFASEIQSEHFYYKTSPFELMAIPIPDFLLIDCLQVMKTLGLALAGIDLRRTKEGEFVFFEANPSPQYLIFEDKCGYPLTQTLVELLCGQDSPNM